MITRTDQDAWASPASWRRRRVQANGGKPIERSDNESLIVGEFAQIIAVHRSFTPKGDHGGGDAMDAAQVVLELSNS